MRRDVWYSARLISVFGVVLLALTGFAALAQEGEPSADGTDGLPATMAGFSDAGALHLYVNEERVGTIKFRWQADGTFENTSTITMDGQSMAQSLKIVPGKDGRWRYMAIEAPSMGRVTLERKGSLARRTAREEVKTITPTVWAGLWTDTADFDGSIMVARPWVTPTTWYCFRMSASAW